MEDSNLWPDDLADSDLVTPLIILREQAAALGPKTKNIVTADVTSGQDNNYFVHTLKLSAPTIRYTYQLLYIRHDISLYPLLGYYKGNAKQLRTEEEFVDWLRVIFNSEETKRVVRALIAQSREAKQ